MPTLSMHLEEGQGADQDGGFSASAPANHSSPRVWDNRELTPSPRQIHIVEIKNFEDTRPRTARGCQL